VEPKGKGMGMKRILAGVIAVGLLSLSVRADAPESTVASDLALWVSAGDSLFDLNITLDQLEKLQALASNTAGKVVEAQANEIDETAAQEAACVAVLTNLRDALEADDRAKIIADRNQLEDMEDNLEADFSPDVPLTGAARNKAGAAMKLFTTTQIAQYIGQHGEDVPDAGETIVQAMNESRGWPEADFGPYRTQVAEQVAALVGGLKPAVDAPVRKNVLDLLNRAHGLSDDDYAQQQGDLERQAREIGKSVSSALEVRHWMEWEMADLLANPKLPDVLSARIAHEQSAGTTQPSGQPSGQATGGN
jgi:hypothetical protein